jgi:phage terminase large subunit-like protein
MTAEFTRNNVTDDLLGEHGRRGTGFIPADELGHIEPMKGGQVSNQVDWFEVRHYGPDGKFNGWSKFHVFAYAKGWQRLGGLTLDFVFCDEEPYPYEVFDELQSRLSVTNGYLLIGETPLYGDSELMVHFEEKGWTDPEGQHTATDPENWELIKYNIFDCDHLTEEDQQRIIKQKEGSPLFDARVMGEPVSGFGPLYIASNDQVICDPIPIPVHWPQIIGIDFPHTTGAYAAVKLAWNQTEDIVYVIAEYKQKGLARLIYIEATKLMGGDRINCAWPHDGGRKDEADGHGPSTAMAYRKSGLKMLGIHAHMIDDKGKKSTATMPIIEECNDRMLTGRLKFFNTCPMIAREKRLYKAKDGRIVTRQDDHCLDGMHKGMMMLNWGRPPEISSAMKRSTPPRLPQIDFYTGERHAPHIQGGQRRR